MILTSVVEEMGKKKSKKKGAEQMSTAGVALVSDSSLPGPVVENAVLNPTLSTPTQSQILVQHTPMVVFQKAEADMLIATRANLLEENDRLKVQLHSLLHEAQESNIRIKQKDLEIDELRRENEKLRERIKELESDVHTLKSEVRYLNGKVANSDLKEEYGKFVIALQDLNRIYSLERHSLLSSSTRSRMCKLRSSRIESFHYIYECDSIDVQKYKQLKALSELKRDMTPECRAVFAKKNGDSFLSEIINCLASVVPKTSVTIADAEKSEADDWWDDVV
jgi:predicted RNase H-like nuclease (RuvC/YqgF family)